MRPRCAASTTVVSAPTAAAAASSFTDDPISTRTSATACDDYAIRKRTTATSYIGRTAPTTAYRVGRRRARSSVSSAIEETRGTCQAAASDKDVERFSRSDD